MRMSQNFEVLKDTTQHFHGITEIPPQNVTNLKAALKARFTNSIERMDVLQAVKQLSGKIRIGKSQFSETHIF